LWPDTGFDDPPGFMVNDSKFATAFRPVILIEKETKKGY
jgi:hypothetical protein